MNPQQRRHSGTLRPWRRLLAGDFCGLSKKQKRWQDAGGTKSLLRWL
jgi:hypothetical protein